jgi:uncharacterized membrane protein YfcA
MGFLIVWVGVVAGVGALLAGWMFGPQAAIAGLQSAVSPERAALVLLVVVVLLDLLNTVRHRRRR